MGSLLTFGGCSYWGIRNLCTGGRGFRGICELARFDQTLSYSLRPIIGLGSGWRSRRDEFSVNVGCFRWLCSGRVPTQGSMGSFRSMGKGESSNCQGLRPELRRTDEP